MSACESDKSAWGFLIEQRKKKNRRQTEKRVHERRLANSINKTAQNERIVICKAKEKKFVSGRAAKNLEMCLVAFGYKKK
jgi:hypothetical protein